MALNRKNLGFSTQVSAATTSSVYTVGSAQTAYIKSVLIHNLSSNAIQNAQIHVVPNNAGSVGSVSSITRIVRVGISTNDTFFFEPAYPIVLPSTGDSLQITNEGSSPTSINVLVLGDKEV